MGFSLGTWLATGVNLDSGTTCSTLFGATNFTGSTDAVLGQLANNGGPTLTHALQAGSDAIDAASDCTSFDGHETITTDQRGVSRPQGSQCDVGAFEVVQESAIKLSKTITGGDPFATEGDEITYSLVATNTGDVTLTGVMIVDTRLDTMDCEPEIPATIDPGAQIICSGHYTATAADVQAGSITNIATADSDQTDPVDATAIVELADLPDIAISPGALDFGEVAINTSNASRSVTLTNTGKGNAQIDGLSGPGAPFTIDGGACLPLPTLVEVNDGCTIVVTFAPTQTIEFSGSLEIFSNDPSSPHTIALAGTGMMTAIPVPTNNPWALAVLLLVVGLTGWLALFRGRHSKTHLASGH